MDSEQRAAEHALEAARFESISVVRIGIGADNVRRALASIMLREHKPKLMILFGIAGGLIDQPDAVCVGMVVDERGREWACPVAVPLKNGEEPVAVVGVDRLIATPAEKTQLQRKTAAAIVDMESHAFAEACTTAKVAWAVVRGVSDGPGHELPLEMLNWVRPDGSSRVGRVLWDFVRRPKLIRTVAKAVPQMFRGLGAGSKRLVELVAQQTAPEAESPALPVSEE